MDNDATTTPLGQRLRALVVEDSPTDAELTIRQLRHAGFDPIWRRVETEAEYLAALSPDLDVILADFNMPAFSALRALDLLKVSRFDIPLIVVSGSIGEDVAVQAVRSGAADYLLKDRLARLGQAIQRVIEERRLRRQQRDAEDALATAEERTRFALEAARVGVWEVDLRTGATRWSDTLEAMHGLTPGSFGGTLQDFIQAIAPEDRQQAQDSIDRATREHIDSHILYRSHWPDGSLHWLRSVGRTYYDEDGAPLRAAGIGLDDTQGHLMEEQYQQSQKMEAIGQLAGGIAHDFNNLLTAILGYCELLEEALGDQHPQQGDLREIHRAADRAASLTQQLLAFGRRQILAPRVVDLADALSRMESMLRRLIGEDIEVVVRTPSVAALVKADTGQIEQVILNLALNARDAMPRGGTLLIEIGEVELDDEYARRHEKMTAGRYVMLAVSDTGVGMDAATCARVFEPFFTTKPLGKGTGLGLSTVYGIVKQSGGSIWLYSEPGQGTTFKVYLPSADEAIERPRTSATPVSLVGSETILVVEDEPAVCELTRRILERYGYEVLVAATPNEALALVRQHTQEIHLLLSDLVLPGMTGRVLAEQIVSTRPAVRVLFTSGYTDNVIVHRGGLDPRTPFLQKPFSSEMLARRVRETLDASSG